MSEQDEVKKSCGFCIHGKHQCPSAVQCRYPRERQPEVVDLTVIRGGTAWTRNEAAEICKHFTPTKTL